jgi:hypothetical protein
VDPVPDPLLLRKSGSAGNQRSDIEAVHSLPYRPSIGFENGWNLTTKRTTAAYICEASLVSR